LVNSASLLPAAEPSSAPPRFAASLLYDVSPTDPVTFVAVIVVLAVAGLAATLIPALRAAKIQSVDALRLR